MHVIILHGHRCGVYAHAYCVYVFYLFLHTYLYAMRRKDTNYPDARFTFTCKLAKYKNKDDPGHFHLMKADD